MEMKEHRHLFWSASGEMLPRWLEAFANAKCLSFDTACADDSLPVMAWVRLTPGQAVDEQIGAARKWLGGIPIVVLSDLPNDQEALAAFAAAARGYCNSHATSATLQQVANVVLQGGLWIGESLMQRLIRVTGTVAVPAGATASNWENKLTGREKEVAHIVAAGSSNKEIARQLGITERTVKSHITTILEKLGIRDRLQLALIVHKK